MSLCPIELDALGLGRSRVGRLDRLISPHVPQSSNLSRVCGTRNPTVFIRSIYPISHNLIYLITLEGLTTPLTRGVASIRYLCAGTVYIVLLGPTTRLITLVS